jgi:hypothetical protein
MTRVPSEVKPEDDIFNNSAVIANENVRLQEVHDAVTYD